MKKLTVIVSSFNRPEGLKRSLNSLYNQSIWPDFDIIICDDGSTDQEVCGILDAFGEEPNVTVFYGESRPVEYKEKCCTFTELINVAMNSAHDAEYFSYLCDGDEYTPNRCETYMKFLDENPGIFLVWGISQTVRDGVAKLMPTYRKLTPQQVVLKLNNGNFIDHNAAMHRATTARWNTSIDSWKFADWLYWMRLLNKGYRFANIKFHGEMFHDTKDSLGRCLVEKGETFREMYARRVGEEGAKKKAVADPKTRGYAKNVSGKTQQVDGMMISPDEIVVAAIVTTADGRLYPDFESFGDFPIYEPKKPKLPRKPLSETIRDLKKRKEKG